MFISFYLSSPWLRYISLSSPGRARGRVAQRLLLGGGEIEGCQSERLANPVAAVGVEEEGHPFRSEVAVAVFRA